MIPMPAQAQLRRRTGRKWSLHPDDVIPAWIADMDFDPAPPIRQTLEEAIEIGDLGYGPAAAASGVPEAFARWAARRWGWRVDPTDVMLSPDVVGAIANCIEALTEPRDAVLVQTPAYPPLLSSVRVAGRELVEHELACGPIDFAGLETLVESRRVRLILFCHPHNPTGRVFCVEELDALARIAERQDAIVVSDEVHADLTYAERRHLPFAPFQPHRTVTLNAPSKAFNIAGLRTAVCAATAPLRERLAALPPTRWNAFSTLGLRAARAAWSDAGESWLNACLLHLANMRDRLARRLKADCPDIRYVKPQAGYLAWLDCRALELDDPAGFFLEHARVALSPGPDFGAPGEGFVRLNFAMSEDMVDQMVARMGRALAAR